MMSKKEFKKLANKHLFALEKPRNAFGRTELEVFGKDELYEQLQLYFVSQRSELLNRFLDWQDEDNGMQNDKEWNKKYLDRYFKSIL